MLQFLGEMHLESTKPECSKTAKMKLYELIVMVFSTPLGALLVIKAHKDEWDVAITAYKT